MIEDIKELKSGAVLSESSHYIVKDILGSNVRLTHYESNSEVTIDLNYLKKYTNSADLFTRTEKVTKEDKRDGTLGIRSIWENIHSGQVFTLVKYSLYALRSRISLRPRRGLMRRLILS